MLTLATILAYIGSCLFCFAGGLYIGEARGWARRGNFCAELCPLHEIAQSSTVLAAEANARMQG